MIQEFAHARARRRDRRDAARLAADAAELLSPLLVIDEATLRHGLRLFERHDGLGAFDAVLAASALDTGATSLVSADRAFGAVPRLPFVDLASPKLDQLVRVG